MEYGGNSSTEIKGDVRLAPKSRSNFSLIERRETKMMLLLPGLVYWKRGNPMSDGLWEKRSV